MAASDMGLQRHAPPAAARRLAGPLAALMLIALVAAAAQPQACPGYSEAGQGADWLDFQADIPKEHLRDIFTPERFSQILTGLVDGLQLEVLQVQT